MARAVLVLALVALCGCSAPATEALSGITLTNCSTAALPSARCGTYEVWENRAARSGRRVPLHVLVLPARGEKREPDPVFFFNGGPGAAATDAAVFVGGLLAGVNESRDLVFVDVRGTGGSGALRCDLAPADAPLQRYFDDFLSEDYVRRCLAGQDGDVRFYTQPIAMDDIDEVREALGYERINLLGMSGGTRQAQILMRRHPAIVRSAVMIGVQAMDAEMPTRFARAMESGISWLLDACTRDGGCNGAYPDLAGDWERAKRRFRSGSVDATVRDPRTGREDRVSISRGVFADGIRHMLYDLGRAFELPSRIHAAAQGNFDPFAEAALTQIIALNRSLSFGFFLSSTCAEDVAFIREEDVRRTTEGTFLGDYRVRRQQAACRMWPKGEGIDGGFQDPVRANVPVLIISGEVDVATPAADGERVARALPNATHVIFPNQGHMLANPACAARLIDQFIGTGRTSDLDTTCVGETK